MELSVSLSKTGVSPILPRKAKMLGLERGKIGKKSVTRRQSKAELKEGHWGTEASFTFGSECKMIRTGRKAGIFAFKKNQLADPLEFTAPHECSVLP